MNSAIREVDEERVSSLLYLRGVLPALGEYLRFCEPGWSRGGVVFKGPDHLSGVWPEEEVVRGAGCLELRFPRFRDIIGLFERGRGWFFPVGGWHHLGRLLEFRRNGAAFESALRAGSPGKELIQIQLNLLLRLASLLYGEDEDLRGRVGALPERPIELLFGRAAFPEPAAAWVCARPSGCLSWSTGRATEPVAGRLAVEDPGVIREVFSGSLIGEEAVNRGAVRMSGNIPAIQSLNLVFEALEGRVKPI
mgnify:FL=1